MTTPKTDTSAIAQIIGALKSAGFTLDRIDNGEEVIDLTEVVEPAIRAVEEITAVDSAYLFVENGKVSGYVWFVLGNEPFEVAADYTVNLSDVIETLTDGWS